MYLRVFSRFCRRVVFIAPKRNLRRVSRQAAAPTPPRIRPPSIQGAGQRGHRAGHRHRRERAASYPISIRRTSRFFDEGKEQTIQFFTRERSQPVVVGFLLDMSNASRLHWKNYQDAAIELVQNLLPGDKKFSGYLIGYGNTADCWSTPPTSPSRWWRRCASSSPAAARRYTTRSRWRAPAAS